MNLELTRVYAVVGLHPRVAQIVDAVVLQSVQRREIEIQVVRIPQMELSARVELVLVGLPLLALLDIRYNRH